jgi:hypothetical protein
MASITMALQEILKRYTVLPKTDEGILYNVYRGHTFKHRAEGFYKVYMSSCSEIYR